MVWLCLLLFLINAAICWPLFSVEYTQHFHSNEGTFIALARAMMDRPGDLAWWPLWNAGMPFQYTYLPFLHASTAVTGLTTGWSAARAYHFTTAFYYAAGPVSLFLFTAIASSRARAAFTAALIYSLISPSSLLIPEIAADTGGALLPRRLYSQVYWGDAPHVAALALLPLALLFLYLYLYATRGRPLFGVLAGLAAGLTLLTNAFGMTALLLAVACMIVSGMVPRKHWRIVWIAAICACAYLWISPWLPPSLFQAIRANATQEGDYPAATRVMGATLLLGCAALVWFFSRSLTPWARFVLLLATVYTVIPVAHYAARTVVLPQAWRYHLEMDLGLALLAGFVLPVHRASKSKWQLALLLTVAILAGVLMVRHCRFADRLIQSVDPKTRIEYQVSEILNRDFPGQRVMPAGSIALWTNAFFDVPQLSGGHYPTALNRMQQIAVFAIYTGMNAGELDGEISVLWLKAFGTRAISVSEPGGREHYKPFGNPLKFAGLLPEHWRDGKDVIYRVPSATRSIARVVPGSAIVHRPPIHGLDVADVRAFVAALDDPKLAQLAIIEWRNWHTAVISAAISRDQVLSVQMNYHPGWRAMIDGRAQSVSSDALGMLVISPDRTGSSTLKLEYIGTLEDRVTRTAQVLVLAAGVAWIVASRRRKQVQ